MRLELGGSPALCAGLRVPSGLVLGPLSALFSSFLVFVLPWLRYYLIYPLRLFYRLRALRFIFYVASFFGVFPVSLLYPLLFSTSLSWRPIPVPLLVPLVAIVPTICFAFARDFPSCLLMPAAIIPTIPPASRCPPLRSVSAFPTASPRLPLSSPPSLICALLFCFFRACYLPSGSRMCRVLAPRCCVPLPLLASRFSPGRRTYAFSLSANTICAHTGSFMSFSVRLLAPLTLLCYPVHALLLHAHPFSNPHELTSVI